MLITCINSIKRLRVFGQASPISTRIFPLSLAQLWYTNKVFDKLFLKSSQRESAFAKIKTTLQIKTLPGYS